jgi:hypothetical protein
VKSNWKIGIPQVGRNGPPWPAPCRRCGRPGDCMGAPRPGTAPPPFGGAGGRGAVYRTTGYGRTVAWTAPYGARPGGHGREPCLRARAARADSRHGRLPPFEAVAESFIQQLHFKQPSTFLLRALPGGWADFTQRNKLCKASSNSSVEQIAPSWRSRTPLDTRRGSCKGHQTVASSIIMRLYPVSNLT